MQDIRLSNFTIVHGLPTPFMKTRPASKASVLSDYTFAVRDENNSNQLRIIGKAYSGLTDKEISIITKKLRTIMIRDDVMEE